MSDSPQPDASFRIRGPREFIGGLVFIGVAGLAFWLASDLPGMTGFQFASGTLPRLLAGILALFGAALVVVGLIQNGPSVPVLSLRGPLFVCAALVLFGLGIEPLGLFLSCFALYVIAAMGTPAMRWLETIIGGLVMAALCSLLFATLLGLPFKLFPW